MVDVLTKKQRKKNMKAIKSISQLEKIVSSKLWKRGIRFRRNVRDLYGKPDISIKKYKIVIFIDSCFWHQCPEHGHIPKSNIDFWEEKMKRNIQRDNEVNKYYIDENWNLKRVWEHEIKNDLDGTIDDLVNFIEKYK